MSRHDHPEKPMKYVHVFSDYSEDVKQFESLAAWHIRPSYTTDPPTHVVSAVKFSQKFSLQTPLPVLGQIMNGKGKSEGNRFSKMI